MDTLDAVAINGRWVRLRLSPDNGGRSMDGFVGGVVLAGENSPVESHILFESRISRFSPCGTGSELFFCDIAEVEHVYTSAPFGRVVNLR